MNNTIYILKDFGYINVNIKKIMDNKGISRGKSAKMSALSYDLVNRYYHDKVRRVDLEVIAKFCYILNCNVEDILKYDK